MIELAEVEKIYPRRGAESVAALRGISLTIPTGEIHGIVGESGAGKSTLIRCLTALEKPTSGSIRINGEDLNALPAPKLRAARRTIGMVFQGGNLLEARTAAENIAYPLQIAGEKSAKIAERVRELLGVVGLADRGDSYPSQLSGGQRQRVAIARALATTPSVLLCDEPTSALDADTTLQILELLRDVRDAYGVTVVIITHEMDVVRRICDSVTLLESGRITAGGTIESVLADVSSPLARRLVPAPDIETTNVSGSVIDIAFTARPGETAGSQALSLAARLGCDIGAGVFESIGAIQIARLALVVDDAQVDTVLTAMNEAGITAEVRAA
ncbi:methionine ABC transporter ATP-binding protein [Actinotignum sp. GS-2025c]|uniref:methionine ABC transporter ATP-binding protein n=1 Tax=Actinotignum sp. GS-2025c TaxID=3427276 RepID=UPI003F460F0D